MGRNQTEITKKTKDHEHFKTFGRKARETKAQNLSEGAFLFPLNILEIQGHLMLTWATKNSRKLARLAAKNWS